MKNKYLLIFLFLSNSVGAQSFQLDTAFQPFFDIRSQLGAQIRDVYALPSDSRIYLAGNFKNSNGQSRYDGIVCYSRSGQLCSNFSALGSGSVSVIIRLNDTLFYVANSPPGGFMDSTGNTLKYASWRLNALKTVRCATGQPYFYSDGSSLFANFADNSGQPCKIVNPPDTFPGRYIIKLSPEGLWDSSFVLDANHQPRGFFRYDSTRIIIYGDPKKLKTYDGVAINGMCRVFLDGSLDTTFHSPLKDTNVTSFANPTMVQKNGSFFIKGAFLLKDNNNFQTLAKLNSDGSLDTTFMNYSGATDTIYQVAGVSTIAPTEDGGFIVGGLFTHYQGVVKNGIAKIDSNGRLEPQYFTSVGPDSAKTITGSYKAPAINVILKSKFGGYYVGGDFLTWDGKPTQPIVRITGLDTATSIIETNYKSNQVNIYPNPTNDKLSIETNVGVEQIAIFNVVGKQQEVENLKVSTKTYQLNLSALPPGIYFIRIKMDNGGMISKKVVKQ